MLAVAQPLYAALLKPKKTVSVTFELRPCSLYRTSIKYILNYQDHYSVSSIGEPD
jgi:hypothetical protein